MTIFGVLEGSGLPIGAGSVTISRLVRSGPSTRSRGTLAARSIGIRGVDLGAV
jgi:hypothetical protein